MLQPFVPLSNSGTVPDRFPPGPPAGGWRIGTKRRYMRCFGPAKKVIFTVFCRLCSTWLPKEMGTSVKWRRWSFGTILFGGGSRCWVWARASGRCFLDSFARAGLEQLSNQYTLWWQTAFGAVEKNKTSTTNKTPPRKQKLLPENCEQNTNTINNPKLHNKNTIESIKQEQQTNEKKNNDYITCVKKIAQNSCRPCWLSSPPSGIWIMLCISAITVQLEYEWIKVWMKLMDMCWKHIIYIYITYTGFVVSPFFGGVSTGLTLTITYHHHVSGLLHKRFKELGRFSLQWEAWMQCNVLSLARSLSEDHYLASWSKFESHASTVDGEKNRRIFVPFQRNPNWCRFVVHKRCIPMLCSFWPFLDLLQCDLV